MNKTQPDLTPLQSALGYTFTDPTLLTHALTHRSHGRDNNERLEYLGDSVVGLVVAEALYEKFPAADEGMLTRMRAQLVCKQTLAECARGISLARYVQFGDSVLKSGGGDNDSILADAFEAVVAAIYLDGELPSARRVLRTVLKTQLESAAEHDTKDYKTQLQEWLQKRGLALPEYEVVGRTGKPHEAIFTVACRAGELGAVEATGDSRRDAEQNAAQKMLQMWMTVSINKNV